MRIRLGRFSVHAVMVSALVVAAVLFSMLFTPCVAFADDRLIVVSMGDSYANCEGIEPYYGQDSADKYHNQDWVAHRSSKSWESLLNINGTTLGSVRAVPSSQAVTGSSDGLTTYTYSYKNWSEGSWYFVAASAAKIENVYKSNSYQTREVQTSNSARYAARLAPQIDVIDYINNKYGKGSVDYITVTVGLNDLLLYKAIYNATSSSDSDELRSSIQTGKNTYYSETRGMYIEMLKTLKKKAGSQAHIIVVGYPTMFDGASILDLRNLYFNSTERQLIDGYLKWFDNEMKTLVSDLNKTGFINLHYVSLINAFKGHGAYSFNSYTNTFITPARNEDLDKSGVFAYVSLASLHCNETGAKVTADEVQKVIDEIEEMKASGGNVPTGDVHPSGWAVENGKIYYYDEKGYRCSDMWIAGDAGWGYLDSVGALLINTWWVIDGELYYFGADGTAQSNTWVYYMGAYYYLDNSYHLAVNQWINYDNKYFYYVGADGKAQSNTWVYDKGYYYYLNEDYNLVMSQWIYYKDKYYYVGADGRAQSNTWVYYKGSYYYLNDKGNPVANGWVKYKGNYYYMGSDGKPVTNTWITYNGSRYYFNNRGVCTQKA